MKKVFILILIMLIAFACFAEESELTAKGYVLICTATEQRWFPLPEESEGSCSFTIRQSAGEEEMNNTVTITPEGVFMADSDCENHDCIGEGEVTLENKKDRVLGNMIVCLPHSITIELYSTDELLAMIEK